MEFIEYVKEIVKRIDEEKGVCRVKMGEDDFFLHDECFCDFHSDFMVMYDKRSDVSLVTRYDAITTLQYMPEEKMNEMKKELADGLFEKLMKGVMDD